MILMQEIKTSKRPLETLYKDIKPIQPKDQVWYHDHLSSCVDADLFQATWTSTHLNLLGSTGVEKNPLILIKLFHSTAGAEVLSQLDDRSQSPIIKVPTFFDRRKNTEKNIFSKL